MAGTRNQKPQDFEYKGKKFIKIGKNYWSADKYSEKEALAMAKSLKNCENCLDCSDCVDCVDCTSCWDCSGCRECVWCFNCVDCIDSFDCELGYKLISCEGIYAAENQKYQDWSGTDYGESEGAEWRIRDSKELTKIQKAGVLNTRNKKFYDLIYNKAEKFIGKWGPAARPWKFDPSHQGYHINQGSRG